MSLMLLPTKYYVLMYMFMLCGTQIKRDQKGYQLVYMYVWLGWAMVAGLCKYEMNVKSP